LGKEKKQGACLASLILKHPGGARAEPPRGTRRPAAHRSGSEKPCAEIGNGGPREEGAAVSGCYRGEGGEIPGASVAPFGTVVKSGDIREEEDAAASNRFSREEERRT